MQAIGAFREFGRDHGRSSASLDESKYRLSRDEAKAVERYLKSGETIFDMLGTVIDPLDNSVKIIGGSSLISDGYWVWRKDLPYFVERYRVSLPDQFLSDVRKAIIVTSKLDVRKVSDEAIAAYVRAQQGR